MSTQDTISAQDLSAQIPDKKPIPKDVADRFGISGFRTEKFKNNDEDSSKVDRCSDSPAMTEVLGLIHDAAMSCQIK
jgi:hypothetical protein